MYKYRISNKSQVIHSKNSYRTNYQADQAGKQKIKELGWINSEIQTYQNKTPKDTYNGCGVSDCKMKGPYCTHDSCPFS